MPQAGGNTRLTKTAIEALPTPASGRVYYADTETPGLWLRVLPTGRKVFLFQRKLSGRKIRVTIGPYPSVLPDQARQEVAKHNAAAVKGEDPSQARRKARECHTFGALFAKYVETYSTAHKKDGGKEDRRMFEVYLRPLAGRRMEELALSTLRELQSRLNRDHGPYMANRVLELLGAVWNWGIRMEEPGVPEVNRAAKLTPYPEQSRERFLNADELHALFGALDKEPPVWRDYFMLALLTGARRNNVAGLRWQDVDLDGALWTIPGQLSKNGEPMRVVLSAPAVDILRGRLAEARRGKVMRFYVFPPLQEGTKTGTKAVGHLTETRRAWLRVIKAAREGNPEFVKANPQLLVNVRLHDLRRTMASWQAAGGASLQVIGKSLGHKSLSATAVYSRLDLDPVRTSVEKAAAAMMAAGRGKAGEE